MERNDTPKPKDKINWAFFPSRTLKPLCVGEERTLDAAEIAEANRLLGILFETRNKLEELFDLAHDRFVR